MTASQADYERIRRWLQQVVLRCAATLDIAELEARLATYTDGLAGEVPSNAFCQESLEEISEDFDYFPSYAKLLKALRDWWKDNNPARRLPAPKARERTPPYEPPPPPDWATQPPDAPYGTLYSRTAQAFEAGHGRKLGELDPARLAKLRDDNPLVAEARAFQREQAAMPTPANDTHDRADVSGMLRAAQQSARVRAAATLTPEARRAAPVFPWDDDDPAAGSDEPEPSEDET